MKSWFKLRNASETDVETLFSIRCSVKENYQSRLELESIGISTDSIKEMINSGDYFTIIAELDSMPIGFTMAQISEGYVFACFIRPEFEGRGVGKMLLQTVENKLSEAGVHRAWLSTDSNEELRAIGFYRHLGWREDGYIDNGEIKLVKDL